MRSLVAAVVLACSLGATSAWAGSAAKPHPAPLVVRVVYAYPAGRHARRDYEHAIKNAILSLQGWYFSQVGKTFAIAGPTPRVCRLPRGSEYYASKTWSRLSHDVGSCAPVGQTSRTVWVLYADVRHACHASEPIGRGEPGLAILGRQDLNGLVGAPYFDDCGKRWNFPVGRYIGGLGHELGHAFGLPHPPGCEQNRPGCDARA